MFKRFWISAVMVTSGGAWAQVPVSPPPPEAIAPLEADEQPAPAAMNPSAAQEPAAETSGDKFRNRCRDKTKDGLDDSGAWSILGNGYAELLNTTDARAAFSLALLRANDVCDQLQLGISRGSASNTLVDQGSFARFVLSPETSSWSAQVKFDQWLWPRRSLVLGWYAHGVLGSSDWRVALDPARPEDLTSRSVVALSLGVGGSLSYLKRAGANSLRILAHLGPTTRVLVGEVWGDKPFLSATLGSGQRAYLGLEGGFWIQLNTVSVGMTFPVLVGGVPGLTNGQFLPTISVGGSIDLNSLGAGSS